MILLPKIFRKPNLVILEAAHTTYALIQIQITQKYTEIDVCKILIQPLFVRHDRSLTSFLFIFSNTPFKFFFLGALIHIIIQIVNTTTKN